MSHFSTLSFNSSSLSNFLPARNVYWCRNRDDFHVFLHQKRFADKKFDSNAKLKESLEKWLTSQAADFCE
jgi:hypothetical protein